MKNNENQEMQRELDQRQAEIDKQLSGLLPVSGERYFRLLESMRYSLLAGGKRIRPVLCIKFCEAAGGNPETVLDAACAIEMMHTYSLIHDDLPCMDDSDLRRGKPSNHVRYGEFTATLAGDALQATAFSALLRTELPPDVVVEMMKILSDAAGPYGICGGQYLDLQGVWKPLTKDELTEIHNMKTAALMSAAARIGVIAAGGTQEQIKAAEQYALAVGFAFQVRDDVLDSTAMGGDYGKPVGSDIENNKMTFASLLGINECEQLIRQETENAVAALEGVFEDTEFLTWLARMLADRKS